MTSIFVVLMSLGLAATPLKDALDAQAKGGRLPPEKRAVMERATEALRRGKLVEGSAKVGDTIADFTLPDSAGVPRSLSTFLSKGPVVLTFYRGSWCPYCNLQLRAYQKELRAFREAGAELVAVSPDKPEKGFELAQKEQLQFPVLTDLGNRVAKELGLVFGVPPELKKLYGEFGIDLEASQGNSDWQLPVPATYVVDRNRAIRWAFVDVDYKKRAEPGDILGALERLKRPSAP